MKLFEKESLKLAWKVFEKFVAKSLTKYNGLDKILKIEEKLLTFFGYQLYCYDEWKEVEKSKKVKDICTSD